MLNGRKGKSAGNCLTLWMILLLPGLWLLTACAPEGELRKETDERAFRRGKSLLREGRKDEALQAFLSVAQARPDAAESHLEAGLLYLDHLEDPLSALYHFRQYLGTKPNAKQAEFVRELVRTAEKDFIQSLPGDPLGGGTARTDLMEKVTALQQENTDLKEQLAQYKDTVAKYEKALAQARTRFEEEAVRTGAETDQDVAPIVIAQPGEAAPAAERDVPERYTVQSGDTLSRISRKVYGRSGRWADIFEANRDQLPSPNALQPGQVLRIPE